MVVMTTYYSMYVVMYHIVLLVAKEVTKGSKIGAIYVIDGQVKRPFPNVDFCALILVKNLTCPLQPGNYSLYTVYIYATDSRYTLLMLFSCLELVYRDAIWPRT